MSPADTLIDAWTPQWLGDETLYSLCARYHRIAGHRLASTTCMNLFGHSRVGLSHDLPGHLTAFMTRTRGRLGTADTILLRRTIMGYYLPFLTAERRAEVTRRMLSDGPRGLKADMGWLATRFGAAHPLKACDACVAEDEHRHHIATWRLVHQLPAVWTCPTHATPLWVSTTKVDGLQRFQWLLPDAIQTQQRRFIVDSTWSSKSIEAATAMAVDAAAILALPALGDQEFMATGSVLRRRLVDLGLASSAGRLHQAKVLSALLAHLDRYREFPEAPALCVTGDAALASLRRALTPRDRQLHPLRQLALVQWLFGSWAEFVTVRVDATSSSADQGSHQSHRYPDGPDARRTRLRSLVCEKRCSIRQAAQQLGISTTTAVNWACVMGIPVRRRPKTVSTDLRRVVEAALRRGTAKRDIARESGLSMATVTRILLANPELRVGRTQMQFEALQREARKNLQRAATRHPEFGVKRLREIYPAEFAWLRRNDQAWFDEWKGGLPKSQRAQKQRVDWDLRDQQFEGHLKVISQGCQHDRAEAPSRAQIFREVPGLRTKARKLDNLPHTRLALEALLIKIGRKR